MTRTITTISDAAHEWVREMNAFPRNMIEKLMENDIDSWHEITAFHVGCRVYCNDNSEYGFITDYDEENDMYTIRLDSDVIITASEDSLEKDTYGFLPMWGTMWSFGDSCDDWWLTEDDGLRKMSECGFRIYNSSSSAIYSASRKGLSLYVLCVYKHEAGGFFSANS